MRDIQGVFNFKHYPLEKIGDFDGAPKSTTSKIGCISFGKFSTKGVSFSPFFQKKFRNFFPKITYKKALKVLG